ncbi:MAG: hypothetical protein SFV51_01055 [Bryobacteraceae bacterium]|nr:hypothetical protein [Bryobacteraceae bacterium]
MHPPIREGLEGYLAGKAEAGFLRHLDECAECRQIVNLFEADAKLIRELRAPADLEPPPGFYARVMERVDQQRGSSIWSVFLEPLFARRLMYATAALTLLLGVFLFTSPKDEMGTVAASAPEQILAEELPPSPQLVNAEDDRNIVFVQFATYQGE